MTSVIESAYFEDGNLFVLARISENAPAIHKVTVEVAGQTTDVTASHRRSGSALLIARAIGARPRANALVRLHIGDQPPLETRLTRDRAIFTSADQLLRGLLEQIGRQEAYLLEATAWPESAQREEHTDLAQLGRDLHLDVDFCCVPAPGALLLVAWLDDPGELITAVDLFHGDGDTPFERRLLRFQRADGPPGDRARLRPSAAFALIVEFDETAVPDDDFVLLLASRAGIWTRSLKPRARLDRGPRVLEQHLRPLDPNAQIVILEELSDIVARHGGPAGDAALLRALQAVAIAALPPDITRGDLGVRLALDLACTVGQVGVFLLGWQLLEPALVQAIEFRTPTGGRHEISRDWVTHSRLDVWQRLRNEAIHARSDRLGFLCFIPMPVDPELSTGYILLRWRDGLTFRMRVTLYFSAEDPLDAIKPILTAFPQTHHDLRRLLDQHVGPAVSAVWAQRRGEATGVDVVEHGVPRQDPDASVVIPLYGRFDFMEFQVASFADDPGMRAHEVIYVIDDPVIYDDARLLALDVARTFEFPFRLVYGRRNLGFGGATNLGASLARGRNILMMNSDVMPRHRNWLSDLSAAARALPQAGAVAPVLLYDDGSLQHAGMVYARYPLWADMWVNEHPGKGLPPLPMSEPFEAIAVSGACMMMAADLWRELGGLSDEFIIGDFEDSDLCMRLLSRGLRNWVVPGVTLTHLERQSQDLIGDPAWRTNLSLFNCWTHNRKWGDDISARLERHGTPR